MIVPDALLLLATVSCIVIAAVVVGMISDNLEDRNNDDF